jgi:CRP-like cAMP-binding protein
MSETEIASYVSRYGLDRLLSPELVSALRLRRYGRGEFLMRSGDPVEGLFFFVEGQAKVFHQMENGSSLLVRFYRPFEILGDVELFAFDRYVLNVEALSECACLCLPRAAILESVDRNGRLLANLCGRIGRKLGSYNVSSAINLRYPVENRLASYLLAVQSERGEDAREYRAATVGELADLLGSSYRQLSRVLRRFREEGILGESRGEIVVKDERRLEELARDIYL